MPKPRSLGLSEISWGSSFSMWSVLPLCWTRSVLVCLKLTDKKWRQTEGRVIGLSVFFYFSLSSDRLVLLFFQQWNFSFMFLVLGFMSFNHLLPLLVTYTEHYMQWKDRGAEGIIRLIRTWWCFNSFQVICCWCENSTSKWMVTASPYVLCISASIKILIHAF